MDLTDIGKKPISEAKPSGEDVRYEPEFEELENEIAKLSTPTASEGINWVNVQEKSVDILSGKSKNLLVSCYLSIALMKNENLNGFAVGVHILKDILYEFWESLYPPKKRMRGRVNAIEWWSEKVAQTTAGIKTEKWPQAKYDLFSDDLRAIDSFLGDNVDNAPLLRSMIENLLELIEVEVEQPPEQPVEVGSERACHTDGKAEIDKQ